MQRVELLLVSYWTLAADASTSRFYAVSAAADITEAAIIDQRCPLAAQAEHLVLAVA